MANQTKDIDYMTPEYLMEIHRSALEVIEKIGLEIPRQDIRDKLKTKGVVIKDGRAKYTPSQVVGFLDIQRPGWGLDAVRDIDSSPPDYPLVASIPLAYQYHLDHETDQTMPITKDIMIDEIKFMHSARQAGIEVHGVPLGCPNDVSPKLVPLLQHLLGFKYCGHGGYTWMWPEETSRFLFRMLEITGQQPTQSDLYVLSPLKLAGTEFDFAMDHFDLWESYFIGSHGMTSGNLPAQPIAGYVLSVAETLAASVTLWILSDRLPVEFEIFACPLDLRSMQMLYSGPEFHLMQGMEGKINGFYNGNSNPCAHMFTMAKRPGYQAGAEKAMGVTWAALQRTREIVGAGVLSRDEIFSPEQVLMDWEIVCAGNRLRRGIERENPAEWFRIVEAGIESGYTTTDDTLDHYYDIYWQPELFQRDTLGAWKQNGKPEIRDKLRQLVKNILADYEFEPPKEQMRELQKIYDEAVPVLG